MNHWTLFLLLLLLPACVSAKDIYHIHPMSDSELMTTYESVLRDACRYADKDWHVASFDPSAGYWGDGVNEGNEGIRAIGSMVLACGSLLKYSHTLTHAERREYLSKTTSAIRYAVATHLTGTQKCTNGKQWGKNWQSGMWIGTMAFGVWLIWDDLDPGLRKDFERVVSFEADRFIDKKPPTGRWFDTKAEENGWDLTCIAIAPNMFPSNPHASAWNTKAIEYMMNTLSVPRDVKDKTLVDGRPVSEWVVAPNLHPDFTLENHGFFHPAYVQCSSYFLTQTAMYYTYAGKTVPQAAEHHLMDTWQMFRTILLPWGETAFPQGMDWEQHGLPAINLFASLGTLMDDPTAAEMEKTILQYMRAWQEWCGGDLALPGSPFGFTRHAIQAEQTAHAYLAHKVFTSAPSAGKMPAVRPFVKNYSSIGVVMHRTGSKLTWFSWKNRIMGMIVPIVDDHKSNPFFTIPITNGFVGATELSVKSDAKINVVEHAWKKTSNGFETTGALLTNGDQLKQTIRIASVGEKTVVYQDRVSALKDVSVARELGVPVGIENDSLSGGKRTVHYQDGQAAFDQQKPRKPVTIPGTWANVDGRLGIVTAAGSGMVYSQAAGYNAQAVCADILYGSFSDAPRSFKSGDEAAHRIVLFFTGVTPEETASLAKSVRIEGGVLRFSLPEGGEAEVPIL
jgi:hypothetical protein